MGQPNSKVMVLVYPNSDTDIKATTYEAKIAGGSILPSFI
jgi:hypothetical protein